jgi:hypothetical protein
MLARFRDEMHGPSSARRHNNHVYGKITRPDLSRFSGDAQNQAATGTQQRFLFW